MARAARIYPGICGFQILGVYVARPTHIGNKLGRLAGQTYSRSTVGIYRQPVVLNIRERNFRSPRGLNAFDIGSRDPHADGSVRANALFRFDMQNAVRDSSLDHREQIVVGADLDLEILARSDLYLKNAADIYAAEPRDVPDLGSTDAGPFDRRFE